MITTLCALLLALPAQDDVVVTVDGHPILASEVEQRLLAFVATRTGGRMLPPQQMEALRAEAAPMLLEVMIDEHLLDEAVAEHGVELPAARFEEVMRRSLADYMLLNDVVREDFAARVRRSEGVGLDEFVETRAADPEFRGTILRDELLVELYPERTRVSEEEIAARYESDKAEVFTRPELVRASHILVEVPPGAGEDARDAARERAAGYVADARAPDADFAALARDHSEGPSAPDGGDIGYFSRDGGVVEPFATAAFAMDVGDVSDVVESQFGFHVIRVTGRRDARVVPLAEATPTIRDALRAEKLAEIRAGYVETLRDDAEIVYS